MLAGERLPKDDPVSKDIAARQPSFAADLFGRHVAQRAHHHSPLGACVAQSFSCCVHPGLFGISAESPPGEPEINDLRASFLSDEDVRRFQIAMYDAARMRCG